MIEKDDKNSSNILVWHKIISNIDYGLEYYREIRLDHKLFGIDHNMIIPNYQQNPSPFAIPQQLTTNDAE